MRIPIRRTHEHSDSTTHAHTHPTTQHSLLPQHRLIAIHPILHCHFLHQFADECVRDLLHFFEADAAFAHVELLFAVFGIFGDEPFQQFGVGIDAHVVKIDRILLRGEAREGEGLTRFAMVTRRIQRMRNDVTQSTVTHRRRKTFGQVLHNHIVQFVKRFRPVCRNACQNLFNGISCRFHFIFS